MGNSVSQLPAQYQRIYVNLIQIQNPQKRAETIQTILQSPEYTYAAKQAGIYSHLLHYVAQVQNGRQAPLLPGEQARVASQSERQHSYTLTHHQPQQQTPYEQLAESAQNDKALSYFQACLQVLGLEEEVALTEEALRSAYKKAAIKAHPDKGGSEKAFELVTRSYAYLNEILRRIKGGRDKLRTVEAPTALKDERFKESKEFEHTKPIRLNPDKLDMNAFNQMFEKTRMPDPDEEGYGDWLRGSETSSSAPTFSGKFNRDVFNQMFEQESQKQGRQPQNQLAVVSPQSLVLSPQMGVGLGRERPNDFTEAAPNGAGLKYTDLKAAYTTESTFSGQVQNVRVDIRDYDSYANSRKRAPDPLRDEEREALAAAERAAEAQELQRQIRLQNQKMAEQNYFDRMKQLVLTDGVPIGKTKRT